MKNKILTICVILFMLTLTGCLVNQPYQEKKMAEPTDGLIDKQWQLQQLGSSRRQVTNKAYIRIDANGKVSGFSGCNRFHGKAEFNDEKLSLGSLASTRKACPKVMPFEAKVLKMFRETRRYAINNGQLILYKGNTRLGVFH